MKIAAWLSYNGEPFSGFARQNEQLTVQGSIEEALELLFRRPIETTCAGRTDAGVHALCQVVSFDLLDDEWLRRKPESLLKSLNALTHEAISFRSVRPMPEDFSARFSAVSREYHYYICIDAAAPLLMERFSWHLGKPLDIEAMKEAACFLMGEHDFKSFCMAVSAKGKPTHRYVADINFRQERIWDSNFVVMTVIGNAFLHSMVRTMVGTLVLVGLGKRAPEWVRDVLEARNRQAAGQNAPAQGLVLWHVNYQEQHYYYDPRPHQLLGQIAVENHLSEAIDEAPLGQMDDLRPGRSDESAFDTAGNMSKHEEDGHRPFEMPADRKTARSVAKAAKKASKKKDTKPAKPSSFVEDSAPWAKRRRDKEKEREFVIPRGPNLETAQTGEMPLTAIRQETTGKAVAPAAARESSASATIAAQSAFSGRRAAEQSSSYESSTNVPLIRTDVPSPLRKTRKEEQLAYASLYAVPEVKPMPKPDLAEADTGKLPVVDAAELSADDASVNTSTPHAPNATVLSAASARARRRARENSKGSLD